MKSIVKTKKEVDKLNFEEREGLNIDALQVRLGLNTNRGLIDFFEKNKTIYKGLSQIESKRAVKMGNPRMEEINKKRYKEDIY